LSKAIYFIADLHLGGEIREKETLKEKVLLSFLDHIKDDVEELFIVGDLFDWWIEYREVVPKGHYRLLAKIAEFTEAGIKITYMSGNHDFWRGKYFEEEFGIKISDSHIEKVIEGKKFYIHHGDGLAYNDTGYKILKKILRSKVSQFLYSWVHPDIGIPLAKKTSITSRGYTSKKDYTQKDGLLDVAKQIINERGFDYVIMGHRHFPQAIKEGNGLYVNLGDWICNFTYGKFKNGEFSLRRYYDFKNKAVLPEISNKIS